MFENCLWNHARRHHELKSRQNIALFQFQRLRQDLIGPSCGPLRIRWMSISSCFALCTVFRPDLPLCNNTLFTASRTASQQMWFGWRTETEPACWWSVTELNSTPPLWHQWRPLAASSPCCDPRIRENNSSPAIVLTPLGQLSSYQSTLTDSRKMER